jgi:hypothetical protein
VINQSTRLAAKCIEYYELARKEGYLAFGFVAIVFAMENL